MKPNVVFGLDLIDYDMMGFGWLGYVSSIINNVCVANLP